MNIDRMEKFKSELTTGWEEAAGGDDRVANTKIIIQQAKDAQRAVSKVVAVAAKLGGASEVLGAMLLGEEIARKFDGYSNASVLIAVAIELMASMDMYVEAAEEGIKFEEAKGSN